MDSGRKRFEGRNDICDITLECAVLTICGLDDQRFAHSDLVAGAAVQEKFSNSFSARIFVRAMLRHLLQNWFDGREDFMRVLLIATVFGWFCSVGLAQTDGILTLRPWLYGDPRTAEGHVGRR